MKCANCKQSAMPLIRVNEIGEEGIFWCRDCVERDEPELYRNHIEDLGDVLEAIALTYPELKDKNKPL